MKRLLLFFCFSIGMGSFLIGMDNNIYQSYRGNGGLFDDSETYYSYQWMQVGHSIQVPVNTSTHTYQLELPTYKKEEKKVLGRAFVNGKEAGHYEIIHEEERSGAYLYTANYYPNYYPNNTPTLYHWHLKKEKENLLVMINGDFTFPKQSDRLEAYNQRLQSLQEKEEKAQLWDTHKASISPHIQSDWGLWLTKTTHGKCISGIAAMLALYGTGRILWDTQAQWKKGGTYLLTLLKKMFIKKRKRRKKYHRPAQEVS